jgi:DNA-binding transcriptional LysR family regulator
MDRFAAMRAFVNVADLQGFAPAARKLRLSAPAVTRLVAALEAQLSIQLLRRTTRSVTLTDAGARYLERARRILGDLSEAEQSARAEHSEPLGRLLISAPESFGRRHVAPLLSDFLIEYPRVDAELLLADRLVHLVEEGLDVAVRIGVLADSSLRARAVGATRRVLVASPEYLREHRKVRSPADLKHHSLILLSPLSPTRHWRFVRDGKEEQVPVTPRLVTNSAEAALAHAQRGGGLALLLGYQVKDLVKAGKLEIVLSRQEPPALPIQIVYPSTRLPSANLRAFIDLTLQTRDWNFVAL